MKKSEKNQKDLKKKMETLRLALNEIYFTYGNTKEVIKISQELDDYITIEQKRKLEIK
ncbi:aspartyl-phosphate phosphatase Spo0E family protein [Maledivibacter halophilus]|uniref:Spo0E like sporulation regulatory protein n=1 Tax=Maledivibacter halophilus TaxID=36842 RepID=A0A1T5LTA9_9FIRM|nr:aspartyl-phosphate phosphatase Spo0E family protein [Maledivibacter halophilus]SKC79065.1 Spo0E like sporulation regulatory protein [Maledivibacter halophilus]